MAEREKIERIVAARMKLKARFESALESTPARSDKKPTRQWPGQSPRYAQAATRAAHHQQVARARSRRETQRELGGMEPHHRWSLRASR